MATSLRVLAVASELFPLVKTGGLADVTGALPLALRPLGVEVRTLLPAYPQVEAAALADVATVAEMGGLFGGPARLLAATAPGGAPLLLLEAAHLYARPGGPYQAPDGRDWPDNAFRFAALAWAAREVALGRVGSWRPDLVHAHDWQAGLAPAYLALADGTRPRTLMTIHNLAFQGQVDPALRQALRLPPEAWTMHGVEYYGAIGFLKAGLFYADRITTVSPTYAREIQTPTQGMGLDGLLRHRARDLVGILNGIDEEVWNPARDPLLPAAYDAHDLAGRAAAKAELTRRLGLAEAPEGFLLGVVSRLGWQKGLDLLLAALPDLLGRGGRLALLGAGDPDLEAGFRAAAAAHPDRVGCFFGYDETLAHLVQAGSDAILVPSRFEPCGLTQLCALRYGALPIVARVGGLADTVVDANAAALADGVATGFSFAPVTAEALMDTLDRAMALFADRPAWRTMQRRAMTREVGWRGPARAYARLYESLVEGKHPAHG
jgi:starch synthase